MVPNSFPSTEFVEKAVHLLRDHYKPEKIMLFGSHARGEAGPDSDLDLFVLLKESPLNPFQRVVEMRTMLWPLRQGSNVSLDLIALTKQELLERLALGDQFIEDIVNHSITLHG